jgi:hypothetical protein
VQNGGSLRIAAEIISVDSCTFEGCSTTSSGGAAWLFTSEVGVVSGCTFIGNHAFRGGGLAIDGSGKTALSNTTADENTADAFGGFIFVAGGDLQAVNCAIQGNTAVGFAGAMHASDGTISVASSIVCGNSLPQLYGWSNLGSVSICETCEDCDESVAADAPCNTGIRGDFNCDGVFNEEDYLAIQDQLGICIGDLDGDGQVRASDLGILLGAWSLCP